MVRRLFGLLSLENFDSYLPSHMHTHALDKILGMERNLFGLEHTEQFMTTFTQLLQ